MVPDISEGKARFWDLLVKLFTGLIPAGVLWTGYQTFKTQSKQIATKHRQLGIQQEHLSEEYRRKFWDTKLDFYEQLLHKLADLYTSATNASDFAKKNLEVMNLFFADLQLIALAGR